MNNPNRKHSQLTRIVLFLLMILVGGCVLYPSGNITIDKKLIEVPLLPSPTIEPMPLTVGIYYSPAFQTYEHRQAFSTPGGEIIHVLSLGPASIAVFDQLFKAQFHKVVSTQQRPPFSGNSPKLDVIIEPKIAGANAGGVPVFSDSTGTDVFFSVEYGFSFYDFRGNYIGSFEISGISRENKKVLIRSFRSFLSFETFDLWFSDVNTVEHWVISKMAEKAMREAAAKFLVGFRENTGVQTWLKDLKFSAKGSGG